jgi:hypothetical protein
MPRAAGWTDSVTLEELHGALVLLSCGAGRECSEVAALAGTRIEFARIETVLTVSQLPDHPGHPNWRAAGAYRQARE